MKKYEYMHIKFDFIDNMMNQKLDTFMNKLGVEGWECYAVERSQPITLNLFIFFTNKLAKENTFYFKRELTE